MLHIPGHRDISDLVCRYLCLQITLIFVICTLEGLLLVHSEHFDLKETRKYIHEARRVRIILRAFMMDYTQLDGLLKSVSQQKCT